MVNVGVTTDYLTDYRYLNNFYVKKMSVAFLIWLIFVFLLQRANRDFGELWLDETCHKHDFYVI